MPFLNVDLPLTWFFALGPLVFLIVHAYTLLHFALLADRVGNFHKELEGQIRRPSDREGIRPQLPSSIFVQFLAGPRDIRSGFMGSMLRLIAWISLILGPIALLVFFELQFLPYHDPWVTWWHRFAVFIDVLLLWALWPRIARGTTTWLRWRDFRRPGIWVPLLLSIVPVWLVFGVATFPGEWLHALIPDIELKWTPHKLLVAGEVDPMVGRLRSFGSNRLVLPQIDLREHPKFDTKEKIDSRRTTLWLRTRRLENAILNYAYLPKVDFGGAQLQGARLDGTHLQGAVFTGARLQGASLGLADMRDARLHSAQLQGAEFSAALLQGAWFHGAQLQGALLKVAYLQGALLDRAQLQGASLDRAQLQGASLDRAQLQGASLIEAQLQGASLIEAQLQGASLDRAQLQGALLDRAQLQGASLIEAQLQGALLSGTVVWRADASGIDTTDTYVDKSETGRKYRNPNCDRPDEPCDWSAASYAALRRLIEDTVPAGDMRYAGDLQQQALNRIAILDPENPTESDAAIWAELEKNHPTRENFAERLTDIGCKSENAPFFDGAPYVVRRLLRRLHDLDAITAALAATAFLNEERCPGARGLLEEDKVVLRKIRDRAPQSPAVPAPESKTAQ
ncbi:MAG: pentapeptide repeat-containing protein [Alphaproteobacteria bacterium]